MGTFLPKFVKIYFFNRHSQPLYDVMQREFENLEFVQGVNFEIEDSLKTNGTKYLFQFYKSSEKIRNSKAFVDIATAERHRELCTKYIGHNCFIKANLGETLSHRSPTMFFQNSP